MGKFKLCRSVFLDVGVILSIVGLSAPQAFADRKSNQQKKQHFSLQRRYAFSEKTFQCPGSNTLFNPFTRGTSSDCTDLSEVNFRSGLNKNFLQREYLNLAGSVIANRKIVGIRFSNADLRFVNFQHSVLDNVTFHNTDLRGADLRGARWSGVEFTGHTDLTGALFDEDTKLFLNDQNALFGRTLAFSKHMVAWSENKTGLELPEILIEGLVLDHAKWNDQNQTGYFIFTPYHCKHALPRVYQVNQRTTFDQTQKDYSPDQKLALVTQGAQVVRIDAL